MGFIKIYSGRRRGKSLAGICRECGEDIAGVVQEHMVERHGYIREGAQVFKRQVCGFCGKPGLYRVGGYALCREHKDNLNEERERNNVRLDLERGYREKEIKRVDALEKSRRCLRKVKEK